MIQFGTYAFFPKDDDVPAYLSGIIVGRRQILYEHNVSRWGKWIFRSLICLRGCVAVRPPTHFTSCQGVAELNKIHMNSISFDVHAVSFLFALLDCLFAPGR